MRLFKGILFPKTPINKTASQHDSRTYLPLDISTLSCDIALKNDPCGPRLYLYCAYHMRNVSHICIFIKLNALHNPSKMHRIYFPCFCNILVMCLFIWKQIGFVIMETLSIFCSPLCATMTLSKDLWEVKGRAMSCTFYCSKVAVDSAGWYIKTSIFFFLLHFL